MQTWPDGSNPSIAVGLKRTEAGAGQSGATLQSPSMALWKGQEDDQVVAITKTKKLLDNIWN
jgi:hypothetical protein